MEKNKFNTGVIALLIIACFSLAVAGLVQLYAARTAGAKAEAVVSESEARNQVFYSFVSLDLDENYPDSPEAVLGLYDDSTLILYGGYVTEPDAIKTVLEKQRELYAPEMLELNALEDQYEGLMTALEETAKKKIEIVDIEHVDMYFDRKDPNLCIISSIMRLKGESDLYYNYYLKKGEDGRWKIILRDPVNSRFERPS